MDTKRISPALSPQRKLSLLLPAAVMLAMSLYLFRSGGFYLTHGPTGSPATESRAKTTAAAHEKDAFTAFDKTPLYFIPNKGQIDKSVKYSAKGGGYDYYFAKDKVVLTFSRGAQKPDPQADLPQTHSLSIKFPGANPNVVLRGLEKKTGKVNFLLGGDRKNWRTNIPTYGQVVYEDLYEGVDLVYAGDQRNIKYEFRLAPGADHRLVKMAFGGAEALKLDKAGNLVIKTPLGSLKDKKPYAYQMIGGRKVNVGAGFIIDKNTVGFSLGSYDPAYRLYIDPLIYSTYLGASVEDRGNDIAVMKEAVFVTGATTGNFPVKSMSGGNQAYDITYNGGDSDVFVTRFKLSGNGPSDMIWATYVGGSGTEQGFSIAVDNGLNSYVTGNTDSSGTPVKKFPTQALVGGGLPYDGGFNGAHRDAFFFKLNDSGTGLIYSTYLGGSGIDNGISIALDTTDPVTARAYIHGRTTTPETGTVPFPITLGAFDEDYNGGAEDTFITVLDPEGNGDSDLNYSTYLGGQSDEFSGEIAVDVDKAAYVSGGTNSTDFPVLGAPPYQSINEGSYDVYVSKLDPVGGGAADLKYSTYIGGDQAESARGIALDAYKNVYVTGLTRSDGYGLTPYPTTGGAYLQVHNGGDDAFVTKLLSAGNYSILGYSTFVGGDQDDISWDVVVDSAGRAYITGQTKSNNLFKPGDVSMWDPDKNGGVDDHDVFVARLRADGAPSVSSGPVVYLTYLGGSKVEIGAAIALDRANQIYVTGYTQSDQPPPPSQKFPTTSVVGAKQPYNGSYSGGNTDAFITKLAPGQTCAGACHAWPMLAPSPTSVKLNWLANSMEDLAGYKIYSMDDTTTPIAETTSTSYLIDGLTPGDNYGYILRSYDSSGTLFEPGESAWFTAGNNGDTPALPGAAIQTVSPNSNVGVTFDDVTAGGTTTAQKDAVSNSVSPPSGMEFSGADPIHITTTAGHSGRVTVALKYDAGEVGDESALKLYHWDGGQWQDATEFVDTANNIIVGSDDNLSVWAPVVPLSPATGLNKTFLSAAAFLMVGLGLLLAWFMPFRRSRGAF